MSTVYPPVHSISQTTTVFPRVREVVGMGRRWVFVLSVYDQVGLFRLSRGQRDPNIEIEAGMRSLQLHPGAGSERR